MCNIALPKNECDDFVSYSKKYRIPGLLYQAQHVFSK